MLFGLSLLGVLVAGGLLAATVGGLPVLLGYVAGVVLLLGLAVVRIRRLAAAGTPPPRPACACCDGDHTKPIEVV